MTIRTFFLLWFAVLWVLVLSACTTRIERIPQHKQIVVSETLMQTRAVCSSVKEGRTLVYTCR